MRENKVGTCLPCSSDEAHGHARRAPRSPGTCTPSLQLPPTSQCQTPGEPLGTQRPADSGAGTATSLRLRGRPTPVLGQPLATQSEPVSEDQTGAEGQEEGWGYAVAAVRDGWVGAQRHSVPAAVKTVVLSLEMR